MNDINPGDTYRQLSSHDLYVVEGKIPFNLNGEWVEIVIYAREGLSYARLPDDFVANFDLVESF